MPDLTAGILGFGAGAEGFGVTGLLGFGDDGTVGFEDGTVGFGATGADGLGETVSLGSTGLVIELSLS